VTYRPGPKSAITAAPLDFSDLPAPGWKRVDAFAREYLKVPRGTGAREPFRLRRWQLDIVKALYPMRGVRPRQGLLSLPRGNGKSQLAAVLAAYALYADDVEGAEVVVVATDERQARRVMGTVRRMVELEPRLAEQTQVFADRLMVPHTDSMLTALPADVAAAQGWAPTLALCDELGMVKPDLWDAMALAAGKHERSLCLGISTPADTLDSVMWPLVEYGRDNPEDRSFVLVEYAAPAGCDLADEAAWKAANPALGDFLHLDALRATVRTTREVAFRRYRLGQWVGQSDGWLPWGAWQECAAPDRIVLPGERIVVSFDGSASGDSTALIGCTMDGHLFVVGLWQNEGDPRWRVPRHEVDAAVDSAFDVYDVAELAADPWGWRSEIETWGKRHGEKRVLEWNTAAAQRMAPATDRMFAAVTGQTLTHDGDPRLAGHVANCVAKATTLGDLVVKDKRNSPRKIDAAVAAIVAYDRAAWHANRSRPKRRVVSFQ